MSLYLGNEKITPIAKGSGGGSGTIESLNITPTTNAQTITATGGVDGYSPINVSAVTSSIDENIIAENIKKDVVILGVTGEYEGGGIVDKKKYGLGIDSFIGDTSNGVLQRPTLDETDLVFTGITDLADQALRYSFYGKNVTSVSFPNLVNLSGNNALSDAFYQCSDITTISFPNLKAISGNNALSRTFASISDGTLTVSMPLLESITGEYSVSSMFDWSRALKSISLPSLKTIGYRSGSTWFYGCENLTSVSMPLLETVGSQGAINMFGYCRALTRVDFPKLKNVQMDSFKRPDNWESLFYDCNNLAEIHFRADMINIIPNMYGYENAWGASNATIYFDLAAADVIFNVTPSQDTSIYVDGVEVVNNTIKLGADSDHTYTIINSNYPIYYGVITGLVEDTTTTITKDITSYSGHNITINTNVSDCTVVFNYNGNEKSATIVTSTSYESDDLYSESSITIGYTITKEGYFPKSGTVTFNNSDVSINVTLRSNDIDLSDYEYDIDENNDVVLTRYIGADVETLVIPNVDE